MEALIAQLREFAARRDWGQFHSPKNLAIAVAVEAAELLEHFQWCTEEESRALQPAHLAAVREEIGDVLIYLASLADELGIDPLEAAMEKMRVNEGRYPADQARGSAAKYTEYGA